jgi:hypothetical protein
MRSLWQWLRRREEDEERMSPAERRLATESLEDLQSDRLVEEHLGGKLELEHPDE